MKIIKKMHLTMSDENMFPSTAMFKHLSLYEKGEYPFFLG